MLVDVGAAPDWERREERRGEPRVTPKRARSFASAAGNVVDCCLNALYGQNERAPFVAMFVYYGVVVRRADGGGGEGGGVLLILFIADMECVAQKMARALEERGMDASEFETAVGEMHMRRSTYLSAIDEFHGGLAKEEVDVVLVLQGVDKVRS